MLNVISLLMAVVKLKLNKFLFCNYSNNPSKSMYNTTRSEVISLRELLYSVIPYDNPINPFKLTYDTIETMFRLLALLAVINMFFHALFPIVKKITPIILLCLSFSLHVMCTYWLSHWIELWLFGNIHLPFNVYILKLVPFIISGIYTFLIAE